MYTLDYIACHRVLGIQPKLAASRLCVTPRDNGQTNCSV